jgi:hypothetical protein
LKPKLRLRHLLVGVAWLGVNFAIVHSILSREESISSFPVLSAIVIAGWFSIANATGLCAFLLVFAGDLFD